MEPKRQAARGVEPALEVRGHIQTAPANPSHAPSEEAKSKRDPGQGEVVLTREVHKLLTEALDLIEHIPAPNEFTLAWCARARFILAQE